MVSGLANTVKSTLWYIDADMLAVVRKSVARLALVFVL